MATLALTRVLRTCCTARQPAGLAFARAFASVPSAPLPTHSVVDHHVTGDAMTPSDYFAVVKLGGTQYKVTEGDVVIAEKIKDAKVGEIMDMNEVRHWGVIDDGCSYCCGSSRVESDCL